MFQFITHPLLKKIIESRVKSAFADKDANKTRLKQWLAVAHDGQFTSDAWSYQFNQGKSLVNFGVETSDKLLRIAAEIDVSIKVNYIDHLVWILQIIRVFDDIEQFFII